MPCGALARLTYFGVTVIAVMCQRYFAQCFTHGGCGPVIFGLSRFHIFAKTMHNWASAPFMVWSNSLSSNRFH